MLTRFLTRVTPARAGQSVPVVSFLPLLLALLAAPAVAGTITGNVAFWGDSDGIQLLRVTAHVSLNEPPVANTDLWTPGGNYLLEVDPGTYYVGGYMDRDGSGGPPDPDDPMVMYDPDADGLPETVTVVGTVGGVDLDLGFLYVDADAAGANNGSSWADAFTSLVAGLQAAVPGVEVWVAAGTYVPGALRNSSFLLRSGIAVYGGFRGGETLRSQRNAAHYRSVLSGEIGGPARTDNTYHVVLADSSNSTARLDGFTVTRGHADSYDNFDYMGGGLRSRYGGVTLFDVTFLDNYAISIGGGVASVVADVRAINCAFLGNVAATGNGGGFRGANSGEQIVNSVFSGNSAWRGGAFSMEGGSTPPTLVQLSVSGNSATGEGGGFFLNNQFSVPVTLANSVFWGNTAPDPAKAQISFLVTAPTVSYTTVQGGYAGTGNVASDPLLADPNGADNVYGTIDDDLRPRPTSPVIDAGDNAEVPLDAGDADSDYDLGEVLPMDRLCAERFVDIPWVPDTGAGAPPLVDMGAFEVGLLLFVDGFGSGDTSYWSASVP